MKEFFREQEQGEALLNYIEAYQTLNEEWQKFFIQYTVKFMITLFTIYPNRQEKIHTAKLCLELLPSYDSKCPNKSYSLFFDVDTRTGLLVNRLKYMQLLHSRKLGRKNKSRNIKIQNQKARREIGNQDESDDEIIDIERLQSMQFSLEFLKNVCIQSESQDTIIEHFKSTFIYRRRNFKSILYDFPIILSRPELIYVDFDTIVGRNYGMATPNKFIEEWDNYTDIISKTFDTILSKKKFVDVLEEWDSDVQTFLKLITLLGQVNIDSSRKKCGQREALDKLITFFPNGTSLDFVKCSTTNQMQLIGFGESKQTITSFALCINDYIFKLPKHLTTIKYALDYVFRAMIVLKILFPIGLNQLFNFIQYAFFTMKDIDKVNTSIKTMSMKLGIR